MSDSRLEMTAAYEWGWEKGVDVERERIIALLEADERLGLNGKPGAVASYVIALIKGEQK